MGNTQDSKHINHITCFALNHHMDLFHPLSMHLEANTNSIENVK